MFYVKCLTTEESYVLKSLDEAKFLQEGCKICKRLNDHVLMRYADGSYALYNKYGVNVFRKYKKVYDVHVMFDDFYIAYKSWLGFTNRRFVKGNGSIDWATELYLLRYHFLRG